MTDTVSRQTMDNETLPESWTISVLDEVAEVITGNTPSKRDKSNYGHDLPLVKPGELLDRPVAKAEDNLSEKGAKLARILPPTAVLVSCIGNLGKTAISQVPVAFNQQINAAVFSEAVIPKFGFYYLQTGEVRNWMEKHASATTVTILNKGKFSKLPFPIAPFNEQRRIVEKIEELFTKLDAGVRSLEQTRALLKSYRRSVLKAAVEGELSRKWREAHRDGLEPASELLERILRERREKFVGKKYKEPASPDTSNLPALPDGWEWANLSQFLKEPLRNGHSAKADKDGKVRTLTLTAVTVGDFSEANTKLTGADPNHVSDLWLEPGDIFIERSNTPELVGTAQLYTGERHFAIFPDLLIRARILDGVPASYVELALQSTHARSYFKKSARGISGSMPKISQSTIEAAPIPLPPTQEMKFIVEEVERRLSVVDKLEATVEANLKQAGGLRRSILKRAFSGGLVPQDPDDEPAGALLARIREERQAIERKPRKRRARRDDEAQGRLI